MWSAAVEGVHLLRPGLAHSLPRPVTSPDSPPPQNSKGIFGIVDKVWACLGRERRAEEIGGGVLNSLSLECPKMR